MITSAGETYIKQLMAGTKTALANGVSYGVSGEDLVDGSPLGFELGSSSVTIISYDFVDDVVVIKASLPQDLVATIYEIGLVAAELDATTSSLITTMDSSTENWTGGTWASDYNRIGMDALSLTPSASATQTAQLSGLSLDLSSNSSADEFYIGYRTTNNANLDHIKVQFFTDGSNYYTIQDNVPQFGYKIYRRAKGLAVPTGSPNWADITSIEVFVTANSGGATRVDFDGIRIQNVGGLDPEYTLIARQVLGTPYVKVAGKNEDIEYRLAVNVTS